MGGRSGQSTGGSSGGGADLGSGVDSTDNYKDVTININGTNDTNISTQNLLKLAGIPEDLKGSAEFNFWGGKEVRVFIDSNGMPFIYEKTKLLKLSYLPIKKVIQKDVASLLHVKGSKSPFTIPRPPEQGMTWAGILHLNGFPWMLYEYSDKKLKDTHRKV